MPIQWKIENNLPTNFTLTITDLDTFNEYKLICDQEYIKQFPFVKTLDKFNKLINDILLDSSSGINEISIYNINSESIKFYISLTVKFMILNLKLKYQEFN